MLKQHGFELPQVTYMQILKNNYSGPFVSVGFAGGFHQLQIRKSIFVFPVAVSQSQIPQLCIKNCITDLLLIEPANAKG